MDASAPNKAVAPPARTTITVYGNAQTEFADTISFLEKLYKVTVIQGNDPAAVADIVVVLGSDAKSLTIPNVG